MLKQYMIEVFGDTFIDNNGKEQIIYFDALVDENGDVIVDPTVLFDCYKTFIGFSKGDDKYYDFIISKIKDIRFVPTKLIE